jgi:hypothetical protein
MSSCGNPTPRYGCQLPPPRPSLPSPFSPRGKTSEETSAKNTTTAALDAQKAMNAESLRVNVAMAWLQMAMAMTGKISGR